ncbi:MAG: PAS domain S-box protein, partial [Gemmatimonadetes bacterium]|nr:PAS domain S-box protein [Gemmatimonadota bacterium]NIQ59395.1 PAS domain S-box protein [Gemmatimonadota bacterium]NIU79579.1 PAS domain S-box protein [Gammaproteobacteria bacterium]NIX48801.1 PAS domain S-box protein [Gemmatimonadota bacterium]NIY13258.1 PAS domain S-box protein [Gemmatimonadota bacterium]
MNESGDQAIQSLQAEQVYRLLVDSVRDYAIFVLDPQGRIASWNAGAERLKGYEEEEVVGRHYGMFFPESDREAGRPDLHLELAARDGRLESEGWRIRKDGTRFWAHVVLTALYEDDRLIGFGKVTGDMTVERRARETLEQRERQLAEAQQLAHLGSWEWDVAEGRITWSDELFRIFGIEPGEAITYDRYLALLHPDDRDAVTQKIEAVLESGGSFVHEHRILRPDGEERWVQSRGELTLGDTGDP